MKEELQGKLVEILTSMQTAVGKASDFAMEQLPDVAQSYITYGRLVETTELVVALLVVAGASSAILYGLFSKTADKDGSMSDTRVSCVVGGLMVSFFALPAAMMNFPEVVMVWLAPKVWLLQKIAYMVR